MKENPSFRKRAALTLASVVFVAAGCSTDRTPKPSVHASLAPTPNPNLVVNDLVNCQIIPGDTKAGYAPLLDGDAAVVGGITKDGKKEYAIVINQKGKLISGGIDKNFQPNPFSKTGLEFNDPVSKLNITVDVFSKDSNQITIVAIAECR